MGFLRKKYYVHWVKPNGALLVNGYQLFVLKLIIGITATPITNNE